MDLTVSAVRLSFLGLPFLFAACASSDIEKYSASSQEDISTLVEVRPNDTSTNLFTFTGPSIKTRTGYGAFAKGMLRGGSNLGSVVYLQGQQQLDGQVSHRFIVALQYTNLGGVYREYNLANIDGIDNLRVEAVSRNKQYTPNGVIMTETLGVAVEDAALRALSGGDLILQLGNESGNLELLEIPANYLRAYVTAVDRGPKNGLSQ